MSDEVAREAIGKLQEAITLLKEYESENAALRAENERLQFKYDEIRKWADEQIAAAEERGVKSMAETIMEHMGVLREKRPDRLKNWMNQWRESRKGE